MPARVRELARWRAECGASSEQRADRGARTTVPNQLDRRADVGDRSLRDFFPVVQGDLELVNQGRDVRWSGITHQGGDQRLYFEQEALLRGVGCAHTP